MSGRECVWFGGGGSLLIMFLEVNVRDLTSTPKALELMERGGKVGCIHF